MTALSAQDKGNMKAVFDDCACRAPTGNVQYIKPNPKEVNQGKIVRDEGAVRRTQEALGIKGKDADGMWGNKTTEAVQRKIEQFQKDNGMEVTGRHNAETSEKMKKDPASKNLGAALDGMRNRDLLARVYKPMEKEPGIACDANGKPLPTQQKEPAAKTTSGANAPDESAAETNRLRAAAKSPALSTTRELGMIGNFDGTSAAAAKADAGVHKELMEAIQKREGITQTGKYDATTEQALKAGAQKGLPGYKEMQDHFTKQKEAGLIDNKGSWNESRDTQLRAQAQSAAKPGTNPDDVKINPRAGLSAAAPASQTIIPTVARFSRGADGAFTEMQEGQRTGPGRTYSPSLGGDVSRTAPLVTEKDMQGFAGRMNKFGTPEGVSSVLQGFETNVGSIGSLKVPSLATPGIAPPTATLKIDPFKP